MSLAAGQIIAGKYRLERRLAQGGMGAVWLGTQLGLQRKVALKFDRNERLTSDSSRLEREARAAAALRSPFVVGVIDFGSEDGAGYLVMEYLEGEDLAVLLDREGRLEPNEARDFIRQAALGLQAVHEAGFIHRDVKPSNLFVVRRASPAVLKVLDFGIAKSTKQTSGQETDTGLVLGSAAFMSPEQARGQTLTPASDLWSLAAVFFRALSGRNPFLGENPTDLIVQVCSESPPKIGSLVDLPPSYDRFFERALARDPLRRAQTVEEFLDSLATLEVPSSPTNEPSRGREIGRSGRDDETAPLVPLGAFESSPSDSKAPESEPPSRLRFVVAALFGALVAGILSAAVKKPEEPLVEEPVNASSVLPIARAVPSSNPSSASSEQAALIPRGATSGATVSTSPTKARKPSAPAPTSTAVLPDPVFGLPAEPERP